MQHTHSESVLADLKAEQNKEIKSSWQLHLRIAAAENGGYILSVSRRIVFKNKTILDISKWLKDEGFSERCGYRSGNRT